MLIDETGNFAPEGVTRMGTFFLFFLALCGAKHTHFERVSRVEPASHWLEQEIAEHSGADLGLPDGVSSCAPNGDGIQEYDVRTARVPLYDEVGWLGVAVGQASVGETAKVLADCVREGVFL